MIYISFETLYNTLLNILIKTGLEKERAELCAKLFSETSLDGVYSHGLNRFPRFMSYIKDGYIKIDEKPVKESGFGAIEKWNGNLGPGNLNAYFSMNRAVEISHENGIGVVALKNTNHWMRGGSYGWQAADAGCIGICWTNTTGNMPPWGAKSPDLGNNPMIIAVPRKEGHVVLDMAMAQFSYGKMETAKLHGEKLPVDGGYDISGNLTKDPGAIIESARPLPIGFWKGSGLALVLDMIGAILSEGNTTFQITKFGTERSLNQVFIAFDISKISPQSSIQNTIKEIIDNVHNATPDRNGDKIYYPGERTLMTRQKNLKNGIPVDETIWNEILAM